MNISVPQPMKEWVEARVAAGGFGTVSEYFRQLLRQEQVRQVHEQIEGNLLDALDSGDATRMTPGDWERIRREGRKRIAAKKRRKQ